MSATYNALQIHIFYQYVFPMVQIHNHISSELQENYAMLGPFKQNNKCISFCLRSKKYYF